MQTKIDNIELLGVKEVNDDGVLFGYVDDEGCYHDTLWDYVWTGIFGFCGCGNTDYELKRLAKVIEFVGDEDGKAEVITEDLQIYLYILDAYEFTEHGTQIYSSFLTEKGKVLRKIVEQEMLEL